MQKNFLYITIYTPLKLNSMEDTVKVMIIPLYLYGLIFWNYELLKTAPCGVMVACSLQFRIRLQEKG